MANYTVLHSTSAWHRKPTNWKEWELLQLLAPGVATFSPAAAALAIIDPAKPLFLLVLRIAFFVTNLKSWGSLQLILVTNPSSGSLFEYITSRTAFPHCFTNIRPSLLVHNTILRSPLVIIGLPWSYVTGRRCWLPYCMHRKDTEHKSYNLDADEMALAFLERYDAQRCF